MTKPPMTNRISLSYIGHSVIGHWSFNNCALIGNESAIFVGTVAKGLIRRLAAAAERDSWLVSTERKRIPLGIDEGE